MQTVTVSTLNEQIKQLLETTFLQVAVEGEISRPTYHGSGHVYFSIKDKDAQLKAVMFRGNAARLKFRLEDGMKVVLYGAITLYKPRGEYQVNVSSVEPAGVGNLALAFNQLKERLQNEGLFDSASKKLKPESIRHIALITSGTGAALQDMLRLISKRWPMVKLTLIDVLVQGDQASRQIANAIEHSNALDVDAVIVSRGGGSVEDLWPFNEEIVARTLKSCRHYTVSAVGHEIDWVISDYVADVRAATPTAAIELLLPDQWEYYQTIDALKSQYRHTMQQLIKKQEHKIEGLNEQFQRFSIEKKFEERAQEIKRQRISMQQFHDYNMQQASVKLLQLKEGVVHQFERVLAKKSEAVSAWKQQLEQLNPEKRDQKGYAQLNRLGKKVALEDLKNGDRVLLVTPHHKAEALIESVEKF